MYEPATPTSRTLVPRFARAAERGSDFHHTRSRNSSLLHLPAISVNNSSEIHPLVTIFPSGEHSSREIDLYVACAAGLWSLGESLRPTSRSPLLASHIERS